MSSPLIEVVCVETGDTAECDTPEDAVLAARQLAKDDHEAGYGRRSNHTARFIVDGNVVYEGRIRDLFTTIGRSTP